MTTNRCFFVSDLHGHLDRYDKLFSRIENEGPRAVFIGGDLLPHHMATRLGSVDFVAEEIEGRLRGLDRSAPGRSTRIFLILGNDDERVCEESFLEGDRRGLWTYAHQRWNDLGEHHVVGYSHVPPTPFQLKDWERYDVSRFTDPGCISPERGQRTVPVEPDFSRFATITADLESLSAERDLERAIFLFHSPPYETDLDRAALDGRMVDHVPLDVHVGSIAIKRFIEDRQPLLTLHGHVHESARLTGSWRQKIGRTHAFSAAHDGPELALVRFDLDDLDAATRELI